MAKCGICEQDIISEGVCCDCSERATDIGISVLERKKCGGSGEVEVKKVKPSEADALAQYHKDFLAGKLAVKPLSPWGKGYAVGYHKGRDDVLDDVRSRIQELEAEKDILENMLCDVFTVRHVDNVDIHDIEIKIEVLRGLLEKKEEKKK